MIEEKIKQLAKIPDLELLQELQEMFKLSWDKDKKGEPKDPVIIAGYLHALPLLLGEGAGNYLRFLDKVEQHSLINIPEKGKLQYLYEFNLGNGNLLRNLVGLTLASKLNNQDIYNGFIGLCNNYQVDYLIHENQLNTITNFSRFINIQQQVYNNPDVNLRPIVQYQVSKEFDLPADELFLHAGKIVNQSFLGLYHRYVFNILMCCHELNRSLNLGEIELDNQIYNEKIVQLWANIFAMLDGLGHDWNSIQRIYAVTFNISNE